MKLITRICCLFLLLYPLIGMSSDHTREVYIYVHEPNGYWDYHNPNDYGINNLVSLFVTSHQKQTKYTQEIDAGEHWYRFEVNQANHGEVEEIILGYRDHTQTIDLPSAPGTIYISIFNEKFLPYEVRVFSEHEIQNWLRPDKVRIEGEIELTDHMQKNINERVSLLLPFINWQGARTAYDTRPAADLTWKYLTFDFEVPTIFNTLIFIHYQDRYYPLVTEPGNHYDLKWATNADNEYLTEQEQEKIIYLEALLAELEQSHEEGDGSSDRISEIIEELDKYAQRTIENKKRFNKFTPLSGFTPSEHERLVMQFAEQRHRHRINAQDFFNDRYPYGLTKQAYDELINAFMGDLSTRTDTLFAWSRAIVDFYETRDEDPEELLRHINELGKHSRKDLFEESYEHYLHAQWYNTHEVWDELEALLAIGLLLSLFVFACAIVLKLTKSRFIQTRQINALELVVYGFVCLNIFGQVLLHRHYGVMELSSPSIWILTLSPFAIFYLNMRFLVPNLLFKKRWLTYIGAVAGQTVGYFILAAAISSTTLDHYGLCFVDGSWRWIQSIDKFRGHINIDDLLAIQAALVAFAPAYGLGRHALLNRMPKLQQQKSALKAELTNLKTQISPHFFFNSLNTVYGFALSEDSPKTSEAITKLSDMMRFAIYHGNKDLVPLEKELDYLTDYVELQRLRLNPVRHELKFHVEGDPADLEIAPLLLITLVENAFKHGISMSHDSYICIDLFIQSRGLILTVENSVHAGQLVPVHGKQIEEGGVGLANTQQRLDLLYPGRYEWNVEEDADRYYTQLSIDLIK